jgi:tetratricopeptide (TPR) repeat protein
MGFVAAVLVFALASTGDAASAPKQKISPQQVKAQAKEHFAKGNAAYSVGRFAEALVEFNAAYDAFQAPEFIFNIGQCHLNLGHYDDAAFFYEKYLGLRPDAKVARTQLAEARRLAAEKRASDERDAEAAHIVEQARLASAEQAKLAEARKLEDARHVEAERARKAAAEARAAQDAEDDRNGLLLWGGVGAGAVVIVGAVAAGAVILLTPPAQTVLPSGSLGVVDRRGAS